MLMQQGVMETACYKSHLLKGSLQQGGHGAQVCVCVCGLCVPSFKGGGGDGGVGERE